MGLEVSVRCTRPLAEALATLAAAKQPCQVAMVDGALVFPNAPIPPSWTEVRLRTPAGMVTLRRPTGDRPGDEVSLVVFGNASAEVLAMRERIAAALIA